jgi:hypothetical protein
VIKKTIEESALTLAVYMERLDSYIQSQTALNTTLCKRLEAMDERLDDVRLWRSKVYGARTAFITVGLLVVHTTAVMAGFLALIKWTN